jgi:hypothetical protein
VQYYDGEGSIIVPKSVRPIIDYKETSLGNKKGAKRQFRYGNLHIREYDDYYTVHRDNVDPTEDAIGHLLSDAPEYLAGTISAAFVGYKVGQEVYDRGKAKGKNQRTALYDAILAGCIAGSAAGSVSSYIVTNTIRRKNRSI